MGTAGPGLPHPPRADLPQYRAGGDGSRPSLHPPQPQISQAPTVITEIQSVFLTKCFWIYFSLWQFSQVLLFFWGEDLVNSFHSHSLRKPHLLTHDVWTATAGSFLSCENIRFTDFGGKSSKFIRTLTGSFPPVVCPGEARLSYHLLRWTGVAIACGALAEPLPLCCKYSTEFVPLGLWEDWQLDNKRLLESLSGTLVRLSRPLHTSLPRFSDNPHPGHLWPNPVTLAFPLALDEWPPTPLVQQTSHSRYDCSLFMPLPLSGQTGSPFEAENLTPSGRVLDIVETSIYNSNS